MFVLGVSAVPGQGVWRELGFYLLLLILTNVELHLTAEHDLRRD
jgi:hypothetical protein